MLCIDRDKFYLRVILFIIIFYSSQSILGETEEHFKSWNTVIINGQLSIDNKIKYYLQPEINLIDDKYKLQAAFLFAGLGYQFASNMTVWLMDGYFDIKKLNGDLEHVNAIRQQLDIDLIDTIALKFASIS